VTRAISDPDNVDAEFAVLVRSDLKGLGLGRRLLEKLISYTRDHGLLRLNGITMPNNRGMVTLARKLGLTLIFSWTKVLLPCPSPDISR
jgi:acetyltransferase